MRLTPKESSLFATKTSTKKKKILRPFFLLSLLPLILPRRPAVNAGNGGLSVHALSPPRRKTAPVHVLSALRPAPDGVVEAVDFFIADGTLVGEGFPSARMGTWCCFDWTSRLGCELQPGGGGWRAHTPRCEW
jgi:hypothetical protein